jgi:peptide/nickel transport system substrate-binding protein
MPAKTTHVDDVAHRGLSDVLQQSLTRRDLGRYAAVAGFAVVVSGVDTAQAADATPAAPASPAPERPRGGTVSVAQIGDPESLDPQIASSALAAYVHSNVFDTLIARSAALDYEGILAESWDISADGLEYTFHLRQGISFHDGTPFDADAVKFTFDRAVNPATNSWWRASLSSLKETVVIDPLTVKFVLTEPFAPFLANLSGEANGAILPPAAVQRLGNDFGTNPIGTGAFKFKEWVRGSTITLVRNEQYQNFHSYNENRGAPHLDQLVFRNIPEDATEVAAFESGEVQVIDLPPVEVQRFKADAKYQVIFTPLPDLYFVQFAMNKPSGEFGAQWKPPFDDIRLRQAVGYAIDADSIIAKVLFGLAVRNYGAMPVGLFAYKPEIEQYGFQYLSDKAKALLDEAGWVAAGDGTRTKDGKKLEVLMWTWAQTPNDKIVQVLQNQLAAVGFNVKLEVLEVGTFVSTLVSGPSNLDFAATGDNDPNILKTLVNIAIYPIGFYKNEQYLKLVDQAGKSTDRGERTSLYFEAQKILLADAAIIPLYSSVSAVGVHGVKGVKIATDYTKTYMDAYIEG